MKRNIFYQSLLLCGAALVGCTADNEPANDVRPPVQQEWNAVAQATSDSIVEADETETVTRALFYGGNSRRFYTLWDDGDVVTVYKNNVSVGTMTPQTTGTLSTTLTGTLTGPFAVNDVLDVWRPSANMNFAGQKGTIYDLSKNFVYQKTTAKVLEASNQILTLSDVNPSHQQEYLRFVLTDELGTTRLHPTRLELHAISGGHIVESITEDGTMTTTDLLAIEPESENGEYPGELFVALLNDADAAVTYRIKAHVGEDVYVGPVDIEGQNALTRNSRSFLGKLNRALRKMRLTTPATSLSITPIVSKTYTGSSIVPLASEVIVKDGVTTLTQGTDYSYAFSNNVNVGEATMTITGLAMSGEKAQTKYLGEKTLTFNITKATPVVVMDGSTPADLIVGQGGITRTVSRVYLDNNGNSAYDDVTDLNIGTATVTYTSSDPTIATVNATTGEVTPVSSGSVTITATTPATANWNSQTATYTVNVKTNVGNTNTINDWDNGGTTTDTTTF